MAEKKEQSIWWSIFKIIFACFLLVSAMNGYFLKGAASLSEKAIAATHHYLSADIIKGSEKGKK